MRGGSRGSGGDTYGVGQIFSEDHCVKKLVNEDERPPLPPPLRCFQSSMSVFIFPFVLFTFPSCHWSFARGFLIFRWVIERDH